MPHTRRAVLAKGLLVASTRSVAPLNPPYINSNHRRRVSDDELWSACADHVRWRYNPALGRRMNFAERDLSGLTFPASNAFGMPNPEKLQFLALNGADFTNADLSFCRGGTIAFARSSFQAAILSHSAFFSPRFHSASLWHATCDHVIWGASDDPHAEETLSLIDTEATEASFANAKLRGKFLRVSLIAANMRHADLSHCNFAGCGAGENRCGLSDLSYAKFHHADIEDISFRKARLNEAEFRFARFGARAKWELCESHPELVHIFQELHDA